MEEKKPWSFYDDALVLRFLDFLKDQDKTVEDKDADDLFEQFIAKEGDDSYVYWESYWENPIDDWVNWKNHGGDDAGSVGVRK